MIQILSFFIHEEFSEKAILTVDKAAFCGTQRGPLQHDLVLSFVLPYR